MEKDATRQPHENRQVEVYLDEDDVLAQALGLAEGDYLCITVNVSWPEKGFLEGDVIILTPRQVADAGDIVLIEEEGSVRIGLVSRPGFLETLYGRRPLEATEQIIAVAVALARRMGSNI